MKRIVLLLLIAVLLAACGPSTTSDPFVADSAESAQPETSVSEDDPAEIESEDTESNNTSAQDIDIPGFPATTVQEASIIRARDWKKGADDPLITIIEYGDFQ